MSNQLIRKLHEAFMFCRKDQCELHLFLLLFSVLVRKVYTRKMMALVICYELNCVPLKNYVEVLTLSTCECDLFWTLGLQMSSSSDEAIRVSSSPIKLVSLQEEKSIV